MRNGQNNTFRKKWKEVFFNFPSHMWKEKRFFSIFHLAYEKQSNRKEKKKNTKFRISHKKKRDFFQFSFSHMKKEFFFSIFHLVYKKKKDLFQFFFLYERKIIFYLWKIDKIIYFVKNKKRFSSIFLLSCEKRFFFSIFHFACEKKRYHFLIFLLNDHLGYKLFLLCFCF